MGNAVATLSDRKQLVQRIAASRHFNRSARLRDLLLYLADRVLDEGVTEIHEQEVGREVFGRRADYDTASDNIVRVHASTLRKRLEQYFEEEGADEPVTIEIPKGNYAPVFRARPAAPAPAIETPVPLPAVASPPSNRLAWTFAAVAALFALSTAYLLISRPPAAPVTHSVARPTVTAFWSQIFRPATTTDIVVDDSSVAIYQDVTGRPLKLQEYFDREYLRNLGPREDHLPEIVLRRQTSYANTSFLFRLFELPVDRSRAVLHFARDYSFRELKANSAILLGNSRTNPWIEPFEPKLGLRWTYDAPAGVYHPADTLGGSRVYGGEPGGARESYCGIVLLPNLGGSGNVLIVSGTGGSALTSAAEFLADEKSMSALRGMLPHSTTDAFPPFEALIQVNGRSALPRDKTIVFARSPKT